MQRSATCLSIRLTPHKPRILYMGASLYIGAGLVLASSQILPAQQISAASAIPDAPAPQQTSSFTVSPPPEHRDPQTKRILGIFPNFRAVSAETHLPPQTVNEKFLTASEDSFDYSTIPLPALFALYSEATSATPEFHHGAPGYGRYFWHTYVDQANENYLVEFIVPSITHEDTRYYTLGPGGGGTLKRIGYSLSRIVITRDVGGNDTFNFGEVVGSGAAAGISDLYYPTRERTFTKTAGKWGLNVGVDAAGFMIREFWPDINHDLFHGKVPMATH
jgi:hypothetical protein